MISSWTLGVLAAVQAAVSAAPSPPQQATTAAPVTVNAAPRIAKGTIVAIRIGRTLSSSTSLPGQHFPIALSEPLSPSGAVLLPVGIQGEGEIIHAAKPRWGGKPGELIVNARYLTCGATRIPLGKMKLGGSGENRVGGAMAAAMVFTPLMFAVSGGQMEIPEGASFTATVTADTDLSAGGCAAPAAPIAVEPAPAPAISEDKSQPRGK